jgi:hypothetical protein
MTSRRITSPHVTGTIAAALLIATVAAAPAHAKTPDPDPRPTTTVTIHSTPQTWALVQIGYRAKLDLMPA